MHAQQEPPEEAAGRLGMTIWLDALPHTENLPPLANRRSEDVPTDVRLAEATCVDKLRTGDLILVLDNTRHRSEIRRTMECCTVREAVGQHECAVRRVVATHTTVITVARPHIPIGGADTCDPNRIGEPQRTDTAERINMPASGQVVARLGHHTDLADKMRRHADYEQWRSAYREFKDCQRRASQLYQARIAEQEARRAPLLAAVNGFNAILGERLVDLPSVLLGPDEVGEVSFPVAWFGNNGRLATYLAGLLATGAIQETQYNEALGHLRTLKLHPAEPDADTATTDC